MTRSLALRIMSTNSENSYVAEAAPPEAAAVVISDLSVVIGIMVCAVICVMGLIVMVWCRNNTRSNTNWLGLQAADVALANKGLKKKALRSLPKFRYTNNNKSRSKSSSELSGRECDFSGKEQFDGECCAICLGDFVEGDELRVLPQCSHGFHVACIDMWLSSHSSCPSCRQILLAHTCNKFPKCLAIH